MLEDKCTCLFELIEDFLLCEVFAVLLATIAKGNSENIVSEDLKKI